MAQLFSISKTNDEQIFGLAYNWYLDSKLVLKAFANNCFSDKDRDEFIASLKTGLNYLGSIQGVPSILVHAERHDQITIEGHVFAFGKVSLPLISATMTVAKEDVFNTSLAEIIVVNVLNRHSKMIKAVQDAGFVDTGLKTIAGVYRSKFLESSFFTARKS